MTPSFLLVWATCEATPSASPSLVESGGSGGGATFLDWLTALGTVAAVVVALGFGIVAERRTRQDRRDRAAEVERARESARRAQAQRIAIWAYEDKSSIAIRTGRPAVTIHVVNASDLPVVHVHVPGNAAWNGWVPQQLLPGESKHVDLSYEELAAFDEPFGSRPPDRERLRVIFRDNAGITWTRSFTGELWEECSS